MVVHFDTYKNYIVSTNKITYFDKLRFKEEKIIKQTHNFNMNQSDFYYSFVGLDIILIIPENTKVYKTLHFKLQIIFETSQTKLTLKEHHPFWLT